MLPEQMWLGRDRLLLALSEAPMKNCHKNPPEPPARRLGFWLEGLILTLIGIVGLLALAASALGRVPTHELLWLAAACTALACSLRGLMLVWTRAASGYLALGFLALGMLMCLMTGDRVALYRAAIVSAGFLIAERLWERFGSRGPGH